MANAKDNWGNFCVNLRMRMFKEETFEVKVSVTKIQKQSGTEVSLADLRKPGYWNQCRDGKKDWSNAQKHGIELNFDVEPDGKVAFVTFRLDENRRATLERFIERKNPLMSE